jgi:DNA topoisomerase-1
MAKISGWEKFRKAVTGSYSDKLTFAIAQEEAKRKAEVLAAEKAKLASLKEATRDGDGDGYVNDGKPNQKKAPAKKPAAKKPAATAKPAPKKPAAKKPAATKKTSK